MSSNKLILSILLIALFIVTIALIGYIEYNRDVNGVEMVVDQKSSTEISDSLNCIQIDSLQKK